MKRILIAVFILLSAAAYTQETDSTKTENNKRSKKMDDEDKMKWKAYQDAERDERKNPAYRIDSALRIEHEKRFKRATRVK